MVIHILVPMGIHRQRQQILHSLQLSRIPLFSRITSSILSCVHLALGIKYRTWYFSIVFVLGGIGTSL
jgi:hypothetical protein